MYPPDRSWDCSSHLGTCAHADAPLLCPSWSGREIWPRLKISESKHARQLQTFSVGTKQRTDHPPSFCGSLLWPPVMGNSVGRGTEAASWKSASWLWDFGKGKPSVWNQWRVPKVMSSCRSVIQLMRKGNRRETKIWHLFSPWGESSSWGMKKSRRTSKFEGPGETKNWL